MYMSGLFSLRGLGCVYRAVSPVFGIQIPTAVTVKGIVSPALVSSGDVILAQPDAPARVSTYASQFTVK
jgi:hypothetical protein